jgi:hypothetical protein
LQLTSEHDASEVCSEIINECRPRFLCMLGRRYGRMPLANPAPSPLVMAAAGEGQYGSVIVFRKLRLLRL